MEVAIEVPLTPYKMVREQFHPAFDVEQNETPGQFKDWETKTLRMDLIIEEFLEVLGASGQPSYAIDRIRSEIDAAVGWTLATVDLAAFAKELVDLLYVVYGTLAVLGINGDGVFEEVHWSNMSKAEWDPLKLAYRIRRREDGKILKGTDYKAPDLSRFVS